MAGEASVQNWGSTMNTDYPGEQPLSAVPRISLGDLLRDYGVESVDCERREFAILESTPADVLSRIRNIVFEYHQVDGV